MQREEGRNDSKGSDTSTVPEKEGGERERDNTHLSSFTQARLFWGLVSYQSIMPFRT
jgi:hypothetical protein